MLIYRIERAMDDWSAHDFMSGDDRNDINHGYDIFPFELLEGFRSWYLLQHYPAYGYRPFITEMNLLLEFGDE